MNYKFLIALFLGAAIANWCSKPDKGASLALVSLNSTSRQAVFVDAMACESARAQLAEAGRLEEERLGFRSTVIYTCL